jgi:hypothetical protein
MKRTVNIPKEQKQIIVDALKSYQATAKSLISPTTEDQELIYKDFDMTSLIGIFKDTDIDIRVELPEQLHDGFVHKHGVDFPVYSTEGVSFKEN